MCLPGWPNSMPWACLQRSRLSSLATAGCRTSYALPPADQTSINHVLNPLAFSKYLDLSESVTSLTFPKEADLERLIQRGSTEPSSGESSPRPEGTACEERTASTKSQIISKHSTLNRLQFFDDSHRLQLQFTSPRADRAERPETTAEHSSITSRVDLHQRDQQAQAAQSSNEWEQSVTEAMTEGMMEPWDQSSFFQQLYGQPATALDPVVQLYHMWDDGFQFIEEGSHGYSA